MRSSAVDAWEEGPTLLSSLWRHRWLILITAVYFGVGTYVVSRTLPDKYSASAEVVLSDPTSVRQSFADVVLRPEDVERHVLKQAQRMESAAVIAGAEQRLGPGPASERLRSAVNAAPQVESQRVVVTAEAEQADVAAARANAVVDAYMATAAAEFQAEAQAALAQLDNARTSLTSRIQALGSSTASDVAVQREALLRGLAELETQAQDLAVNASLNGTGVEYVEPAVAPGSPSSASPLRNALLAAILGAAVAGAFGWWRSGRPQGVETPDAPAPVFESPMLGQITDLAPRGLRSLVSRSRSGPLLTDAAVDRAVGEAFHFTVTSLKFALAETRPAAVLFTSAMPGEGKTSIVTNSALALADQEQRVVIVDGDHRGRGLSRALGLDDAPGLSDFISSDLGIEDCMHTVELGPKHRLCVIPAGSRTENTQQFFRVSMVRKAMMRIREEADLVLVDAAPALSVADTTLLASEVDGIVVVVKRGTSIDHLEATRDRLALSQKPILGYVFNRARAEESLHSYYPAYGDR